MGSPDSWFQFSFWVVGKDDWGCRLQCSKKKSQVVPKCCSPVADILWAQGLANIYGGMNHLQVKRWNCLVWSQLSTDDLLHLATKINIQWSYSISVPWPLYGYPNHWGSVLAWALEMTSTPRRRSVVVVWENGEWLIFRASRFQHIKTQHRLGVGDMMGIYDDLCGYN